MQIVVGVINSSGVKYFKVKFHSQSDAFLLSVPQSAFKCKLIAQDMEKFEKMLIQHTSRARHFSSFVSRNETACGRLRGRNNQWKK